MMMMDAAMAMAQSRLVVIKPGALGDTLLLAPALRALRQALPALGITVVGTMPAAGLLRLFGVADEVIAVDRLNLCAPGAAEHSLLNGARVVSFMPLDKAICQDLGEIAGAATIASYPSRSGNTGEHTAVHLHRCVRACFPQTGDLTLAPFACRAAKTTAVDEPYAILAPGAGNAAKRAPMAFFENDALEMMRKGVAPLFIAGEVEAEQGLVHRYPDQYPSCLDPDLEDLAGLMQRSEAVFANDSGPAHLAGILGVPTTVYFGPTDPAVWRPWGPRVSIRRFGCRKARNKE